MGVWSLNSFCNEHVDLASQYVDLTSLSKAQFDAQGHRLMLLADGFAFLFEVFESSSPGWEWSLGGEYFQMSLALEDYIKKLRRGGIELIVFLDPNEGSEGSEKKSHELEKRNRQRCEVIGQLMQLLHDGEGHRHDLSKKLHEIGSKGWQLPPGCTKQAIHTLRKLNVKILTCEEEADNELVQGLTCIPGAYAVLGNDSDFFLMRGARFIPLQHLEVTPDGLVHARVFSPEMVAEALRLSPDRLHELAALCGNDITTEFVDKHAVARALGIQTIRSQHRGDRCHPTQVAAFLRGLPPDTSLIQLPAISSITDSDPAFALALARNADFYNPPPARAASAVEPTRRDDSPLGQLLLQGLAECRMPGWVLAVHRHHLHYCGAKVETMAPDPSPIDTALLPLRRVAYGLVAPPPPGAAATTITDHVRAGHDRPPAAVLATPPHVLRAATGCDDLMSLRALGAAQRCGALLALLRSCADPPPPDPAPPRPDPLAAALTLASAGLGQQAPRAGIALVARALRLLCGAAAPGRPAVGEREVELVVTMGLLLACGAGADALPPLTPPPEALEAAALYLAVAGMVTSLAQLLDVDAAVPPPAALFAGRLFAHLRAGTAAAAALRDRHAPALARLDPAGLVRDALAPLGKGPPAASTVAANPAAQAGPRPAPPPAASSTDSDTTDSDTDSSDSDAGSPAAAGLGAAAGGGGDGGAPLPILEHRSAILAAVATGVVTCIQGETGCGKSSMVPQFLVRAAHARGERVRVLVTQPRRIAAISLARRVACQLGGRPLGELVGYRVGHGGRVDSRQCVVRFVTVGYLLQHLSHCPEHLGRYTHVVLDEVHERTMDMDLLLLLLRRLVHAQAADADAGGGGGGRGAARQTRLVIMSATLQAGMFGEYFAAPGRPARDVIFVGVRRYPVRTIYLDRLLEAFPALRGPVGSAVTKALAAFGPPASRPALPGEGSKALTVPSATARPQVIILPSCYCMSTCDFTLAIFISSEAYWHRF
jgi:hypothetical protein